MFASALLSKFQNWDVNFCVKKWPDFHKDKCRMKWKGNVFVMIKSEQLSSSVSFWNRFEAEISSTSKPSAHSVAKPNSIRPAFQQSQNFATKFQPPTLFLPTQLQRAGVRPAVSSASTQNFSSSSTQSATQASSVGTAVISNKPVLYLPDKETKHQAPLTPASASTIKAPPPAKKQKVEVKSPTKSVPSASVRMLSTYIAQSLFNKFYIFQSGPSVLKAPSSTVGSATVKAGTDEPKVQKMKKPKKFVRAAGGTVWQDDSLLEWDPSITLTHFILLSLVISISF